MKRLLLLTIILSTIRPFTLFADDGMWTFDNPPRKQWKEHYKFEPTDSWLEHLRLASVRLNDGGSGSFVSADGLMVTNQHVASGQLQKVSTKEKDYTKEGFYASTNDKELKCPDLECNVLISFEDVSNRVLAAVRPGASEKEASDQRKSVTAAIEKEETARTGLKCEVISLYSGGEYWLYRFKKYTDIRLVFAVEEQIAFFGGDNDNFTYPRYDLDVAFFRAYEDGKPASTPHYFKWSPSGAAEGDLVILPGNPGSTSRLLTITQIQFQRDVGNLLQRDVWTSRRDALLKYSERGAEQARQAGSSIRSLNNSLKRLVGQQDGLMNPRMMARKEGEEKALRVAVAQKADLQKSYGDAWEQISTAYRDYPQFAARIAFSTLTPSRVDLFGTPFGNPISRLATYATAIVRYAAETAKPNAQRYEELRESNLDSFRFSLLSRAPIYPEMDEHLLAAWLETAEKKLGANDPFVRASLSGQTPAAAAKAVRGTKLGDIEVRKALLEGGAAAVAKSDDPMIVLARNVEPITRELRAWLEQKIQSVETSAGEKLSKARFAVYGRSLPPDANFNLRISYGRVLGYEEDTTLVPYKTTFFGLYDRSRSFDEKPPYDLPRRYREGKEKFDLSTPLNFVYTADTIGGNSGSPVINRNGELVGLNFDSNVQKLPNRYWYVDEAEGGRAVGVHSAAIIEAMKKLYAAEKLVNEILKQ
jgi:peptidase S46-like protein